MAMSERDALAILKQLKESDKTAKDRLDAMRDVLVTIQTDVSALQKRLDEHVEKEEILTRTLSGLLPEFSSKYGQARNET
jgi:gas vesicle protein